MFSLVDLIPGSIAAGIPLVIALFAWRNDRRRY